MKNFKNIVYMGLILFGLVLNSCQEEFEEVGGAEEQQTFMAGSSTSELIVKTSLNDGSFDNIVDGASCIAVQFPYTVDVAGIQITIDSIEDLELIEEIYDEFDDDEDILDFVFPITIILADFTEVVIENKEALRELAAECTEGGDDDDIECIDFVYPITLFTFDINEQETGNFRINSDRELRLFFKNLDDDDLISIDFPVTLVKADGTEIIVNNNAELATALEMAKDECDEDDDDDFNDDDFSKERLDAYLVECPWEVREVKRDGMDQTDQYLEYLMTFTEDGAVSVKDRMGNMLTGEWSTRVSDRGVLLTLEFDVLVDFNLEWVVYEIDEHKIKLYADDGNKIILRQHCADGDGDDDNGDDNGGDDNGIISIETLINTLTECEWIIKDLEVQNEEVQRLLGYEFIFNEDGSVSLGDGITTFDGVWEVGSNEAGDRTLFIEIMMETAVSLEWPLVEIEGSSIVDTTRITLKDEQIGYKMVLQKVCDDNAGDDDVSEIRNIMLGGLWNVALFEDEGVDETDDYAGMDFGFSMFNQVEVSINDDPITAGVWRVLRDTDGNLKFFLNLGDDETFSDLTEAWYIGEVTADRIELIYEDENVNFDKLVFEKKM